MTSIDSGLRFPGESEEYRRERNRLLEAEVAVRRAIEEVAAQRRRLPHGGVVPDDYEFEDAVDGASVRFSELFATGKDTLVVYSFMSRATRETPGQDRRKARRLGFPWPRLRVLRAPRFSTRSMAPRSISRSG